METKKPKKRHRSPSYPGFSLQDAIEKARVIWERETKHATTLDVIADHWGYKPTSSAVKVAVAALLKYGLIEEGEGSKNNRQIKLSERALDILLGDEKEKSDSIKKAAISPKINLELWEEFGAEFPSDESLKNKLVRKKNFNPATVDSYIKNYKDTILFAKLGEGDKVDELKKIFNESQPKHEQITSISVGDYVQWISQGVNQFPSSKRVLGLSDDGKYVFVEGTSTGLPKDQMSIEKPPIKDLPKPPSNPFWSPGEKQPVHTGPSIIFPLSSDNLIEIHLKSKITEADFNRLKDLIDLSKDSLVEA